MCFEKLFELLQAADYFALKNSFWSIQETFQEICKNKRIDMITKLSLVEYYETFIRLFGELYDDFPDIWDYYGKLCDEATEINGISFHYAAKLLWEACHEQYA